MVDIKKSNVEKKREFYNSLRELGLEPKKDSELVTEDNEKQTKENLQRMVKAHQKAKENTNLTEQKVLKAEKTNITSKKEELTRKEIMINHLKEAYK